MFLKFFFHPLLIIYLFTTACSHYPLNPQYNGPKPLPEEIIKEYSYKKFDGPVKETTIESTDVFSVKRIEFKPAHSILPEEDLIQIDYYEKKGNSKKSPVILVLPIMGGPNTIAEIFARYFVKKGFAAVIVHRQEKYNDPKTMEQVNTFLTQIVFDHMQVLDWLEKQDNIDQKKIGVFGVSMGGIKSALLLALDKRVKASVIALGAGDIPYMLAYSSESGLKKKRAAFMKKEGLTEAAFYEKMKTIVTTDPMRFAEYMDAKKALMILARFDTTVPYVKGYELREKMGGPETIKLFTGHFTALPFIFYVRSKAFKFFEKKFSELQDLTKP